MLSKLDHIFNHSHLAGYLALPYRRAADLGTNTKRLTIGPLGVY